MAKIETIEVSLDGSHAVINKKDFNSSTHKMWEEPVEKPPSSKPVGKQQKRTVVKPLTKTTKT